MRNYKRPEVPRGRSGKRAAPHAMRVQWSGFRPMFDFWGNELKRFYQLETLANATEWMLQTNDRFIVSSIQEVLGPPPVTSLSFELFQEGKHQLIFRLEAHNAKRRRALLGFVVAKNAEEHSAVARAEHRHLRILHERVPAMIVQPYRGGHVFLPDRHHRADHGREVYAYCTQWLGGFHELGVNRDLQFFMNVPKSHTFTIAQTEALKGQMVETVVRTYNPAKRDCMDMPEVASGDFVVTAPTHGPLKLKLIACRRLLLRMTPAKLIHRIVSARWDWNGRLFRLPPADPDVLFNAFARALGSEQAPDWFRQYRTAVSRRDFPEQETLPMEDLVRLASAR